MHAFFLTRGIKKDVDELVKFLETRSLALPYVDEEGNKKVMPVQSMLQPIQLWSFVFPENHKDEVLNSLKFDKGNRERWIQNPKSKIMVEGLRLALGADKIPEFKRDKFLFLPQDSLKNISIIPIGVKYDAVNTDLGGNIHEAI